MSKVICIYRSDDVDSLMAIALVSYFYEDVKYTRVYEENIDASLFRGYDTAFLINVLYTPSAVPKKEDVTIALYVTDNKYCYDTERFSQQCFTTLDRKVSIFRLLWNTFLPNKPVPIYASIIEEYRNSISPSEDIKNFYTGLSIICDTVENARDFLFDHPIEDSDIIKLGSLALKAEKSLIKSSSGRYVTYHKLGFLIIALVNSRILPEVHTNFYDLTHLANYYIDGDGNVHFHAKAVTAKAHTCASLSKKLKCKYENSILYKVYPSYEEFRKDFNESTIYNLRPRTYEAKFPMATESHSKHEA